MHAIKTPSNTSQSPSFVLTSFSFQGVSVKSFLPIFDNHSDFFVVLTMEEYDLPRSSTFGTTISNK